MPKMGTTPARQYISVSEVMILDLLTKAADGLWNPWLLGLFLLTGLIYSLGSGFFQVFEWKLWWKSTLGSLLQTQRTQGPGLSSLQALATALASTMGTGSIAGVAAALTLGGPGAVFWMWVSAFLGMMTSCGEKLLSVRYQRSGPDGTLQGGPMFYLKDGLHAPILGAFFALVGLPATLAGGNLVQSSSIALSLEAAFGLPRLSVGLCTALAAGLVMVGGVGRIARSSTALVPAMALLYIGGALAVLLHNVSALPEAFHLIISCAFSPSAALGGGCGWTIAQAMRYGIARGVFTNEAGLGTSAMAHGAAQVDHPARQGMWGIFEVFLSTLVVCTLTALAVLVSGVLTSCGEKLLSVRYQRSGPDGTLQGGPMFYLKDGLHAPILGAFFALVGLPATLAGGNLVQSSSIALSLEAAFGLPRLSVGLCTALAAGLVMVGGVGRIARSSTALVPAMALLYIGGALAVLLHNVSALPEAFHLIISCAFSPSAALGGGCGWTIAQAMRYGIARGVFTNEAGLGTSAMAHGAAQVDHPARQGMWGIFEVFLSTLVVCTLTALAVLVSGVFHPEAPSSLTGAPLTAAAFSSALGPMGSGIVALSLLLFAFTSILGWSYYGQQCLNYLTGGKGLGLYRAVFLLCIVLGAVWEPGTVWQLVDLCSALMALPNLTALLLLAPEALRLLRQFQNFTHI